MMAEHHTERAALNRRARALLRSDGTLQGSDIEIGGQTFAVGDQIICRAPSQLRPAGGGRGSEIRNGTRGTVTTIHDDAAPASEIDFENRGPVRVPTELLTKPVRGRSVVGVITTATASPPTPPKATPTGPGGSSPPTPQHAKASTSDSPRRTDAKVYVVAYDQLDPNSRRPDDLLPRVTRDIDPVTATARRLTTAPANAPGIEHEEGLR